MIVIYYLYTNVHGMDTVPLQRSRAVGLFKKSITRVVQVSASPQELCGVDR